MSGLYRSAAGERAVRQRYLELLDRWPVPAQRLRIPTREGETFVLASGPHDAPAVLALQGSGANTAMWIGQIGAWARSLRVYAVDVIGEPGLSAPSRPPLASDAYANWLDDVLDGLGLRRTAIVGVSLGGWLGLDYAIRRPDRVSRLVLLNPGGLGRQKILAPAAAGMLAMLGARRRGLQLALGPVARAGDRSPVAELVGLISRHFRRRLVRVPRFALAALSGVDAPVLALLGARDAMLDARGSARRLTALPHPTIRTLPDAGHLLPDQTGTVLDFLRPPRADTVREVAGVRALVCAPDGPTVHGDAEVVDIVGHALGEHAELVVLPVDRLDPAFFDLRTGLAGLVTQKFATYRLPLAVVGDISGYLADSSPLRALVREANHGRQLSFVADIDAIDPQRLHGPAPAG